MNSWYNISTIKQKTQDWFKHYLIIIKNNEFILNIWNNAPRYAVNLPIDNTTKKYPSGLLFAAIIRNRVQIVNEMLSHSELLEPKELYYSYIYRALYITAISRTMVELSNTIDDIQNLDKTIDNIQISDKTDDLEDQLHKLEDVFETNVDQTNMLLSLLFSKTDVKYHNVLFKHLLQLSRENEDNYLPDSLPKFLYSNANIAQNILNKLLEINIIGDAEDNVDCILDYGYSEYDYGYLLALENHLPKMVNKFRNHINIPDLFSDMLEHENEGNEKDNIIIFLYDEFSEHELNELCLIAIEHDSMQYLDMLLNKYDDKEEALKELSFIAIDLNNFYYLDALVARNLDINSSLLYAISKNNTQIVYHFLLIGAKNYDQALEFAENQNATEIIEMIKEFKYANTVMSSIAA